MRHTGTLRSWNEDRGFGFIAPTDGGQEIFVHVSALNRGEGRPTLNEKLSYEVENDPQGKPRAVNVRREALASSLRRREPRVPTRRSPFAKPLILLLLMAVGAFVGLGHLRSSGPPTQALLDADAAPKASPSAEPTPRFRCDGRTHCSQMTSCTEATFFLKNCPGTEMDGDHDGVPCEQQWCT